MNENHVSAGLQHEYTNSKSGVWFAQFATLGYIHKPLMTANGLISFSDAAFQSGIYKKKTPKQSIAPQYHASLTMPLSHSWSFHSEVDFSYHHNREGDVYLASEENPIINNVAFNKFNLVLYNTILKRLNKTNTLSLNLRGDFDWSKYYYTGNYPLIQHEKKQKFNASAQYQLSVPGLQFTFKSGADFFWRNMGGKFYRTVEPTVKTTLRYSFNNRHSLDFSCEYTSSAPASFIIDDHLYQINELLYQQGNPELDNTNEIKTLLTYIWRPSKSFYSSIYGLWQRSFNKTAAIYNVMESGTSILRSYIMNGNYDHFAAGFSLNFRLLDGNLNLRGTPTLWHQRYRGIYHGSYTSVRFNLSAYYYLGNFNFSAGYKSPSPYVFDNGMKAKIYGAYNIGAGWGNGKWTVTLDLWNPFSRSFKNMTRKFNSDLYSFYNIYHGLDCHSNVSFQAVYTFGYGKQISHNNERRPD